MSKNAIRLVPSGRVRIGRTKASPGGWLSSPSAPAPGARARLGFASPVDQTTPEGLGYYALNRLLLPEQLWKLYKTTPDVRACVDSITRRIATWDWSLKVTVDPRDRAEYDRLTEKAQKATEWLKVPNLNRETWQEVMTRTVIDLLIYDAGVLELHTTARTGKLLELVPWLGSEWFPVYNEKGVLISYKQVSETTGKVVPVKPEKLLYASLFKNNRERLGVPLLETLVNECVTVLLSSERAMLALDADEIPPGLLVIGGVAGPAAERARADLQQMRGKDHKVRVISSPNPGGIEAKWVELRHSLKDVQLIEVIDQMRRAIWRVFGVMPVELGVGDATPRALAEVQVDVSSSHLITPILELLQARLQTQVLPLLVGKDSAYIKFEFDRAQPLTPEQRLDLARAQDVHVRRGIITVNEARAKLGLLPIDGGDIAIVDTNEGPLPLTMVAAGERISDPDTDPDSGSDPDDPDDDPGGGGGDSSGAADDDDDDDPDGGREAGNLENRAHPSCVHGDHEHSVARMKGRTSEWLPSDWPSAERFEGYRTLDLRKLADVVSAYNRDIFGLYDEASRESQAIVLNSYGPDGSLDAGEAARAMAEVDARIIQLHQQWSISSEPHYRQAAAIGHAAAESFLDSPVPDDYRDEATGYHDQAMRWLIEPSGLLGALRAKCREILLNASGSRTRSRIDEVGPEDSAERVAEVMALTFSAESARVDNWSGKSVALAYAVLSRALDETLAPGEAREEWMVEWVAQGGRMCTTCDTEGARGFVPLSALSVRPGDGTLCQGHCRCVLVFWTKSEVDGGDAVKLSAVAPGGPDVPVTP